MEGEGGGFVFGQRGEEGSGGDGEVVVLREDVPLVVHAEGALADAEAELVAEAHDDGGVGEIFTLEPVAQAVALRGVEALQPGIAADSAGRAGAGVGGAGAVLVSGHALGQAGTGFASGALAEDCTLADFEGGVRRVPGVCAGGWGVTGKR